MSESESLFETTGEELGRLYEYQKVIDGTGSGHLWLSHQPAFEGAPMHVTFAGVGQIPDENAHGLPPIFAASVELYYSGPISVEFAQEQINKLVNRNFSE